MATLMTNLTVNDWGTSAGVAITSSNASIEVTGLEGTEGYVSLWYYETDVRGSALKIMDDEFDYHGRSKNPPAYYRIDQNGVFNFSLLSGTGYLWAKLEGLTGRVFVGSGVNATINFAA